MSTRYINPLNDVAFKKIFGTETNKDLLIALLNEILRGRHFIVDLIYCKNEHPGDIETEGGMTFDLLCTGELNERFLIEVQSKKQENFKERILFYASKLITDQAPKGKRKDWGYALNGVYVIAILEKFVLEGMPEDTYLNDISLTNRTTGEIFYDKLGFTFIELRKFVKKEEELHTDLELWMYFLKHLSEFEEMPANLEHTIFEKFFDITEYSKMTKEEKIMYDRSLKKKWDDKNIMDYAVKEGRLEGELRGKIEGRLENAIAIAIEMKRESMPVAQIIKFTKLTAEQIEELV